jgi:phospholipid transport system substrate-binding protein
MRGLVRLLAVSVFFCLALALVSAKAWASPAMEQLRSTVDEVISILSNPNLKKPDQEKRLRQMLRQVINQRFDYQEMAKRSLSRYWRPLSSSQRVEFVRLFSELLERSYAGKIEAYSNEKVIYQSERLDGDYAEIRTIVVRPNDQIPINYRMIDKGGKWWVYDVVIEGVSLVSNYRSQFGRIIRESSYQELVRRMQSKLKEQRAVERL